MRSTCLLTILISLSACGGTPPTACNKESVREYKSMGSPTAYSPFYGVWFHDKLYNALGDADQNTIPEQFVNSVEYQMNKFDRECQI